MPQDVQQPDSLPGLSLGSNHPAAGSGSFSQIEAPQEGNQAGNSQSVSEGESVPVAPVLGLSAEALTGPTYASMWHRFQAYFADLIVVYLIVFVLYFLSGVVQKPLSAEKEEFQIAFILSLFLYMTVAQTAYHTTIGKYVMGIEVRSARLDKKYPSFWRVLLRETVGRILSSLFWGAGYWTAIRRTEKQAWSDQLAGTIVSYRPTLKVLKLAFSAFIVVAFVVDVGIIGYGMYTEQHNKEYAAFVTEIKAVASDVQSARAAVNQRNNSDAKDLDSWQIRSRALKVELDQYEFQLRRMQELIQKGLRENLTASDTERRQFEVLQQVYDLRQQQVKKLREEAGLILDCDGTAFSLSRLNSQLRILDSDIAGLDYKSSQLLTSIGMK
jgi:hypothetical protein